MVILMLSSMMKLVISEMTVLDLDPREDNNNIKLMYNVRTCIYSGMFFLCLDRNLYYWYRTVASHSFKNQIVS